MPRGLKFLSPITAPARRQRFHESFWRRLREAWKRSRDVYIGGSLVLTAELTLALATACVAIHTAWWRACTNMPASESKLLGQRTAKCLATTMDPAPAAQSLVHVLAAMAPCTRLYGYLGCQLARTQRAGAPSHPYSHWCGGRHFWLSESPSARPKGAAVQSAGLQTARRCSLPPPPLSVAAAAVCGCSRFGACGLWISTSRGECRCRWGCLCCAQKHAASFSYHSPLYCWCSRSYVLSGGCHTRLALIPGIPWLQDPDIQQPGLPGDACGQGAHHRPAGRQRALWYSTVHMILRQVPT